MDKTGTIGWIDITVDDASGLKDFYEQVVGWKTEAVSLGDYDDYNVSPPQQGEAIAGICNKRGFNAGVPSSWMIYINVNNLDESLAATEAGGGKIIRPDTSMGSMGRYAIIEDPAGAVCALFEPKEG